MKRRVSLILTALTIFSNFVQAEDLKLNDGRVLKNYRIINHSPKDAMVIHDGGAETVLLKDLPQKLREKYEYSEERAEAYEKQKSIEQSIYLEEQRLRKEKLKQELEEKRRLIELRKQAERIKFKVFNVSEDGLLVLHRKWRSERVWESRRALVVGNGTSSIKNGYWKTVSVEVPSDEVSLIVGYPMDGVVDGQLIDGYFARIGTYSYETVEGGRATVKKFMYFPK